MSREESRGPKQAEGKRAVCAPGAYGHNVGTGVAKRREDERLRAISHTKRNPLGSE